jgi:predicted amidohydrolase YtcJ
MARAYNFKGVLDAGGVAVMGTDWPVSALDPWIGFEAMITRKDPTGAHPGAFYGEGLTLEQAIRVMTINGAWSMGIDQTAGSIAPGKSADLIVLDRNLFEIEIDGSLHDAEVELTLLQGQPTWDCAGLLESSGVEPVWSPPAPEL